MQLEVITSFYNPCSYHRLTANYWQFRDSLPCDLTTIELSFDGNFAIPDAVQVQGCADNIMWQKERLLNILIERSTADAIAWVDADLIFNNQNWLHETQQKLAQFPVVQLFQNVIDLDADGEQIRTLPGYVWGRDQGISGHLRPGGAWAARRDVLQHGLLDDHIIGGGDVMLLIGMTGWWKHPLLKQIGHNWRQKTLRDAAQIYPTVRNHLGYITGNCHHLYHGEQANRNYVGRLAKLTDHAFDPDEDIAIDANGLWKWNSDKPEMHQAVASYFEERREDD